MIESIFTILVTGLSTNLINRERKILRQATYTFWSARFVFIGAQEIHITSFKNGKMVIQN